MPGDMCTTLGIISFLPLTLAIDLILGASGFWLGSRTGAGGTA
jgi:hypothetical protein